MLQTFCCAQTKALFNGRRVARFVNFEAVALRKLQQLHAATVLEFLRIPPGNRLEALSGDRQGQHSSASTTNGACALFGEKAMPMTLKSWITTERHHHDP
jgi:proteic killer suppression protein